MVQLADKQETRELIKKILSLYSYIEGNGDIETADKLKGLAGKVQDAEFSIAFCGHFSAGKSSMINHLVGDKLLPSSPIPTSANLVKVKTGEEYAKVYFKSEKPHLYPAPYDYEKVKTYCKDGDEIQSVEISHASQTLPKGVSVLDTPGIDSTDDAHRIATESALHLADLVLYVMDYNHVQSELNFMFTKELTEEGKEVYLIINQVDKHRDEELSFLQFKKSVTDSFSAWGVKPERIFYTSLKNEEHPFNELPALKEFIQKKIHQKDNLLPTSINQSLTKLMEEHKQYLLEKDKPNFDALQAVIDSYSSEEQVTAFEKFNEVKTRIEKLNQIIEDKKQLLEEDLVSIQKSAYLMPAQTRDLAEEYLQSVQPDFKVGLFFSKQKTEQERTARRHAFFTDFRKQVQTQLEWHLKEQLLKRIKESELQDPELMTSVQGLSLEIAESLLDEVVKKGAGLSGQYVLNYTNDLSDAVKKIARVEITPLYERFIQRIDEKNKKEQQKLNEQFNVWKKLVDALQSQEELLERHAEFARQLESILKGDRAIPTDLDAFLTKLLDEDVIVQRSEDDWTKQPIIEKVERQQLEKIETNQEHEPLSSEGIEKLAYKLTNTAEQVKELPGFKRISTDLIRKSESLLSKEFTVALFGAFSAGKSSFANALIGEKLLPVSPNPTTAAINKIKPITDIHGHGTVLVQLKDSDTLFQDVLRSLKVFEMTASSFEEALGQIGKIIEHVTDFDANEKTHYAFLHAFYKGFSVYQNQLGDILTTSMEEFADFVAKEEKSCLVEYIEVYYDCPLTRKGITLVDTPGADSINARHTGVAFEYIKNSDAILFVTYYNHAFSKADREFLIQLGRVKDAFELDKMFFIVNAIDLANDEEEKQSVMEYVEDQLIKYGIRHPHLYPISSLHALKEKREDTKEQASGIHPFEESFYSFISNDLMKMTVAAAEHEWKRTLKQLQSFIQSSQEDKEVKQEKRNQLKQEHLLIKDEINQLDGRFEINRASQETDELTYYIKQRVFFRLNDFFKESFNPTVLKDDGRNLKKALQGALDDFLTSFGYDFAQELRATTIRLEIFIRKTLREKESAIHHSLNERNERLSFSEFETNEWNQLEFQSAFVEMDQMIFKKPLSLFKNPKSFFEKNEKKLVMEELEQSLQQPANHYLKVGNERLKGYYSDIIDMEMTRMKEELLLQVDEFYLGLLTALTDEIPVDQLIEIEQNIIQQ
ncbi:dynamin family protein [Cytobacillus spongiae]|uniref:dynamin family protein n=1 Tax=Cytobacillus spongiae TaxID=2901381 RepID=UPI001F3E8D40|nr:dynamin family protein [Cytobacillus spongiae]UII54566.1 dynamin family protein [Cytobacillus spongiae]